MPHAVLPLHMTAPKWRPIIKRARRRWLRLVRDQRAQAGVVGAAFSLSLVLLILYFRGRFLGFETASTTATQRNFDGDPQGDQLSLFIAIGSAPRNAELREAARSGWLRWLPADTQVTYRFFSDAPPVQSKASLASETESMWQRLGKEADTYNDLVLQPLPTGYGDNEHNAYAQRARYQVKWALSETERLDFYLRIDDDSFLCLHKLLYEVKSLPRRQFFWGRFWCREGRNRADENFMLFSRDVAELLANDALVGRILPFDEQVTLGWNFGYWSWVLNLTIFDDQRRLDAQQGYLTKYMHGESVADEATLRGFCETHIYAHHVHAATMTAAYAATSIHLMYPLPERRGPAETCPRLAQTFVPARHSAALPDLRLGRSANAR